MKMPAKGIVGALLLTATMSVAAFPVNVTSIDGIFNNTNDGSGNNVAGEGTSLISWGASGQSSYGFLGANPLPVINDASYFQFGTLEHTNGKVTGPTLKSADLAVTLGFAASGDTGTGEGTFVFHHDETPDTACTGPVIFGICFGSRTGDVDDTVTLFDTSVTSSNFTLGGFEYSLELLGFNSQSTPERTVGSYGLFAKLNATEVPASVPEPGTLALLGLGLVGMGVTRRRKA